VCHIPATTSWAVGLPSEAYLQLGLEVKFDFWGRLPWKLCGLAHHDQDDARQVAAEVLVSFDEFFGDDPSYVHHALSVVFLAKTGLLRAQVLAFAEGGPMGRELFAEVAKLRFIPVVERSIEAKHSLITRRVQKNFRTGRVVSLILRVPDLKETMRRDNDFILRFAEIFTKVRNPKQAASLLGISSHPSLMVASRAKAKSNVIFGLLNRIIYHCDHTSRFEDFALARQKNTREADRRGRVAARYCKGAMFDAAQLHKQSGNREHGNRERSNEQIGIWSRESLTCKVSKL
jgi:hypothetical protein